MLIGSDEEKALVHDIDNNFPGSNQFFCSKHLKDGALNYMQTKIGVSQKDRMNICDSIFGEQGVINANDSIDFERKSKRVLVKAATYPKFLDYFNNKLQPSVKNYVHAPTKRTNSTSNWINNNCENLYQLDANWKVKSTPDLINMLQGFTLLHFKDFKRALSNEGNYRLYGK